MLINVFAFADRPTSRAMRSRTEVVTIPHDATFHAFTRLLAETGHTRFPVLGPAGIDDIQGIISAKDLFVAQSTAPMDPQTSIQSLVRPAFFTPQSKRIGDLLQELRAQRIRMAIVVDEYGGMAGIVTMEDLLEEIVGELADERENEHDDIQAIDAQTSIVEGQTRVEEVNAELDLQLPLGDYETLAGFLLLRLGRVPDVGTSLATDGVRLTVIEMQGPRIKRIEIHKG